MKYFSTFSGIGGFELGIQKAYDSNRYRRNTKKSSTNDRVSANTKSHKWFGESPTCIGYSEVDKYACQIYDKHFKHKNYGDITTINAQELPDFDLLVGGFPCQAFSIAGKRGGFEDTRGTLFFDVARIVGEKQPQNIVLENVKGLLSHDKGQTFRTIINTLDELGYDIEWQVLNSKNFGVPQNRERVFIIGHLRGSGGRKIFPITGESTEDTRRTGQEVSYTIDANYHKGTNTTKKGRRQIIKVKGYLDDETWRKRHESIRRVYDIDGISPTIPTGTGGGVMPKIVKVSGDLDKRKTYLGDIASTLAANPTSDNTARLYDGAKIRRLTPTECERLQGFPDGWTEGVSDTQRYKTLGNAVTVNVIEHIFKQLIKAL